MTCGECGCKDLTKQNVKGRFFNWKNFKSIKNTQDLYLLVCNNCKNIITKAGDAQLLDDSIKLSIIEHKK